MIRALLLAVSAISGAAALGRKLADKSIEERLTSEIEAAKTIAIAELDREIETVVAQRLGAYALALLVKAGLVAMVYLMVVSGMITTLAFKMAVAGLVAAYVGYDIVKMLPHMPLAWRIFRDYGFNLKRAVTEYVARVAFERAYRETWSRLHKGTARGVLAISSFSADKLSGDVAEAVADVAHKTSFSRIRPRVVVACVKAGVMFALYAGFLAFITLA